MAEFTELLCASLAPDLGMRLLKEDGRFAVYAGLWGTWWLNDANRAAKVVLVTVLRSPARAPPAGPLRLADLTPWIVLQLQRVDEDSGGGLWEALRGLLADDFRPRPERVVETPGNAPRLVFDPSQDTHAVRAVAEPAALAALPLEATAAAGDQPRPQPLLNRRRVEYRVLDWPGVRAFVEKPTAKQPLQHEMEADAGLLRSSTVLGAVNEWRTWFVVDAL